MWFSLNDECKAMRYKFLRCHLNSKWLFGYRNPSLSCQKLGRRERRQSLESTADYSTEELAREQRTLSERKEGSGRPRPSTVEEIVIFVREMIEGDCHLSYPAISRVTDIEETSVRCILKQDLGKKSLCSRWIPHILTDDNKRIRVTCCQEMLNVYSEGMQRKRSLWSMKNGFIFETYLQKNAIEFGWMVQMIVPLLHDGQYLIAKFWLLLSATMKTHLFRTSSRRWIDQRC